MSSPVEDLRARVREKLGLKGQLLGQGGLKAILGEPGRRIPQPLWEKLPPQVQTRIQDVRKLRPKILEQEPLLERLKTLRPLEAHKPSIVDRPHPKPTGMAVEGEPAYPYNTLSVIVE